ncbi:MAG TPA: DEAD/DEAH box helicase [Solirubrobacteraceae bacterium]|nr:DEAD/DEAH box helicase [Solirubrobacteraceae bacterium]
MSCSRFTATLERGEAVLSFPYDERLRRLLRAIPGRHWDAQRRAWCLPLAPETAEALTLLLAGLPEKPDVSDELARELRRQRVRRAARECLLELARPDQDWWLSFAAEADDGCVAALLEHPDARLMPAIGRGLLPLDERAREIVGELERRGSRLVLSPPVRRALQALQPRAEDRAVTHAHGRDAPGTAPDRGEQPQPFDVSFRRDREGAHWILLQGPLAPRARGLCAASGLRWRPAPGGSLGVRALEHDADALAQLLEGLGEPTIEPRVRSWLGRARAWRGTIEVAGSRAEPLFVLLGESTRLPHALRERARSVPGGATLPLSAASLRLIESLDGWFSEASRRCVLALREGRPAPPAVLESSQAHEPAAFLLAPGHDAACVARFAALPGAIAPQRRRAGRGGESLWAIRADPFCVEELDRFLAEHGVWVAPAALELLQEIREQHARAAGLVDLSGAHDADLEVPSLGGELKPFQRAGVAYLLQRRRAFLADEQGLGKTIEALAALEADDAFPAVIVCPASLKLNWMRELARWLPGRAARALNGNRDAGGKAAARADVTVVNYDIVAARGAELRALQPRALVLDESHYCKNANAKRTQAVAQLAAAVPREGLLLALTGTPVVNRPSELIAQLRILGRLEEFGSGAQFGERFRGPDAHLRLHWHLRARCLVRRMKVDVLPQLPAKTRSIVPIELDNEPEYRFAERDVVAWLASQPLDLRELDAKVAAALRAERLVRLNALKLLAARGKLRAALTWIHDFCASGERLVVFARHREIQQRVLEHFPAALHILGQDRPLERERALDAFQLPDGPENQLIVCSLEVAGQGLTLTRSSNVAFLELDWTPAKHDQAEDRCHRIGQHDAVNAYYLLAAQTVDESIATLLERKRAVIAAVTDGREEDEGGVLDALVRELRGAPYRHLRAVA